MLTQAKCPNCDGFIKVDAANKAGICEFCGQPFVVEDAVAYFNINNSYTIDHVDNVIVDANESKSLAKKGAAHLSLGEFSEAAMAFRDATDEDPSMSDAWFGLVRALTHEFSKAPDTASDLCEAREAFKKGKHFASASESRSIQESWDKWFTDSKAEAEERFGRSEALLSILAESLTEKEENLSSITEELTSSRKVEKESGSRAEGLKSSPVAVVVLVLILIPIGRGFFEMLFSGKPFKTYELVIVAILAIAVVVVIAKAVLRAKAMGDWSRSMAAVAKLEKELAVAEKEREAANRAFIAARTDSGELSRLVVEYSR